MKYRTAYNILFVATAILFGATCTATALYVVHETVCDFEKTPLEKAAQVINDQPLAFVLVANTYDESSFTYSSVDLPVYALETDRDLCSVLKIPECFIRAVRFTRPGIMYISTVEPANMVFYGVARAGDSESWIDKSVAGRVHVVGEEL